MKKTWAVIFSWIYIIPVLCAQDAPYRMNNTIDEIPEQDSAVIIKTAEKCVNAFLYNDYWTLEKSVRMDEKGLDFIKRSLDFFGAQKKEYGEIKFIRLRDVKNIILKEPIPQDSRLEGTTYFEEKMVHVLVAGFNFPEQSLVLYDAVFEKETIVFTLVFFKEDGEWILKFLEQRPATIKNKDYRYYWGLADEASLKNRFLQAFLFYQISADLLEISPYYRYRDDYEKLGTQTDFLAQRNVCLKGPVEWHLGEENTITVFMQRYFYLMGELYVHIFFVGEDIYNENILLLQARQIMDYLKRYYSEDIVCFKGFFISAFETVPKEKNEQSSTVKGDWQGEFTVFELAEK